MGVIAESENIEVIRIFSDVLCQVGLGCGQGTVEVGNRFPLFVDIDTRYLI